MWGRVVKKGSGRILPVYYGEFTCKLDEKGRITVPRRIRQIMDVLGHAVWYMTRGYDRCIFLFHQEEWNNICERISQFHSMDASVLDFRRFLFSSVTQVKPDNQGRMPVPEHLRAHAELDKEAVILGVNDHLEIWDKESWRGFVQSKEADYKQMAIPVFSETGKERREE